MLFFLNDRVTVTLYHARDTIAIYILLTMLIKKCGLRSPHFQFANSVLFYAFYDLIIYLIEFACKLLVRKQIGLLQRR